VQTPTSRVHAVLARFCQILPVFLQVINLLQIDNH
jgi:hypothetical protein